MNMGINDFNVHEPLWQLHWGGHVPEGVSVEADFGRNQRPPAPNSMRKGPVPQSR